MVMARLGSLTPTLFSKKQDFDHHCFLSLLSIKREHQRPTIGVCLFGEVELDLLLKLFMFSANRACLDGVWGLSSQAC